MGPKALLGLDSLGVGDGPHREDDQKSVVILGDNHSL